MRKGGSEMRPHTQQRQNDLVRSLVAALIEVGRIDRDVAPDWAPGPEGARQFLHRLGHDWAGLSGQLSRDDLACLIKGIVRCTRVWGAMVTGGSTTCVPALYAVFVDRFPDDEPDLTSWVVAHRVNPYEPYGTMKCNDAPTLGLYQIAQFGQAYTRRVHMEAEEARRLEAVARNAVVATGRLAAAVRRGDHAAVQALLDKGADPSRALPDGSSLLETARANGRNKVVAILQERGIQ